MRIIAAMLIVALVAGCMPTGGFTEEGTSSNNDPYQKAGVEWSTESKPRSIDTDQPLQPLPPDVQQQMRSGQ